VKEEVTGNGSSAMVDGDGEYIAPVKKYNKSSFFDEVCATVTATAIASAISIAVVIRCSTTAISCVTLCCHCSLHRCEAKSEILLYCLLLK
jgi:hypothetical protein